RPVILEGGHFYLRVDSLDEVPSQPAVRSWRCPSYTLPVSACILQQYHGIPSRSTG
ncbi:hypothetical protein EMPG_17539, partial [Blastomyces silverae]